MNEPDGERETREPDDEEQRLRTAALQNVQSIVRARARAEQELLRTKEALEEETRMLELLNRTGAALASNLDLQSLLQAVTDAATQLSGAQFGAFFYTAGTPEDGLFKLFTLSGAPREAFERFGHPRNTPIFAPTFKGEGPIRLDDVRADPRYGQLAPHFGMPAGHLPVCSYLAVPVVGRGGEVIGGLFFGHRDCGVFTARAERLVVGVAAQAAVAIDNARMFEQTRRASDERARMLRAEREARAEVERVSVMKDEFLATLSHELRTPLNAMLGWTDLLLSRIKDDAGTRRGLEVIARNARAQAQLIDDLLDMNRIVSGKIRLDVQPVDLAAIVEDAVESVRPSAEARSISLRKTLDPFAGPVFGDPNRLQQVVWNLLSNAVKFTPKGGNVDLLVQRINSHVEIAVQDSGIGIAAEFLPHIFERFRQADSSTTRRYGGLGLGLSIVKQLVELHGGTVRVSSGGDGQGSTFTVELPVRVMHDARPTPVAEGRTVAVAKPVGDTEMSLRGIRVLVVDDEADARELMRTLLSDAEAEVLVAAGADEGLALVRDRQPDVIVSDIGMAGKDGYDFMRDVRALPATGGQVPAIAVTAFARSEDRTRALRAGYQVHLAKPLQAPELIATIRSLVLYRRRD